MLANIFELATRICNMPTTDMNRSSIFILLLLVIACAGKRNAVGARSKSPNVLFIICDDLNDYVEGLGGHPQAVTPNIRKLAESGISFTQAHCNIPICSPSRASLFCGLYPHTSGVYGFEHWDLNEVLQNSRTMMAHFRANGYLAHGTGKVMHNRDRREWNQYGHLADYGPFAFNGKDNVAHPDVGSPMREEFGAIDGSYGPLIKLEGRKSPVTGKPFSWRTGNWKKMSTLRYESDDDRDPTGDELNAQWAIEKLKAQAAKRSPRPIFLGVGFVRPHTPLIVPQKYFDRYPLDQIELPDILANDLEDTFKHTVDSGDTDRGGAIYRALMSSHGGNRELALKKFIQAYLASVASVDDLVGQIMEVVDNTHLKDNTIVVFTSDHGWAMGEKDYVYKNTLWQESTRVPLIVRAPGVSKKGVSDVPVSLVDLYPTLIDLCGLPKNTMKNNKGRPLDGRSLKPLLQDPRNGKWTGPGAALTALYKWAQIYDPKKQSYSLRSRDWRYIRYANGKEELYDTRRDFHEWNNVAAESRHAKVRDRFRRQLDDMLKDAAPPTVAKRTAPAAKKWDWFGAVDQNKDGKVLLDEWLAWSEAADRKKGVEFDRQKRTGSFNWFDKNKNGHLDPGELK